jgi:hypothetical protein
MRVRTLIAAPILFVTLHSAAQQPARSSSQSVASKAIWQLTDDERIAERLDPQKIRERAASHTAALNRLHNPDTSTLSTRIPETTPTKFIIDGAEHPELFLPFELFGQLLRGVDATLKPVDREVSRSILDGKIKAFGYDPATFWNALEASARPYFEVRSGAKVGTAANATQHATVESIPSPSQSIDSHVSLCRARLTALNAARHHFGREQFDKFLYAVVAPTLTVASDAPGPAEGTGLRYLSGGCQ